MTPLAEFVGLLYVVALEAYEHIPHSCNHLGSLEAAVKSTRDAYEALQRGSDAQDMLMGAASHLREYFITTGPWIHTVQQDVAGPINDVTIMFSKQVSGELDVGDLARTEYVIQQLEKIPEPPEGISLN